MKQRVLIYGMNYAPEIAGVGRYTGEIGEHLAKFGHEVTVITTPAHYPGWRVQDGPNGWTRDEVAGARVYRCPLYLNEKMNGMKRLLAPLSFAVSSAPVALWQILRRRPHVVIAVEPTLFVGPLALLGAWLVGARSVLHIQDLEVEAAFAVGHLGEGGLISRLAGAFDRWMATSFDRIVTISERMAEKVRAKGVQADRVMIVRNWVDLDRIQPDQDASAYRRELGLAEDDFVVLYAGNLGAKQGVRLLVQAAERLTNRPDVVFLIAGDGPMRGELQAAAKRLPNLRLIGFQPEVRFGEFLSLAGAHVLPQEREAADLLLPSKLGGMLASGKPIVVTADEGTELSDFLGGSCHVTPPGDPDALAGAVLLAADASPCPRQRAERLERASVLAKTSGLKAFTDAALFLQSAQPTAAARLKAA